MGTATRSKWIIQALEANLSELTKDMRTNAIEIAGKDTSPIMKIIANPLQQIERELSVMRKIMEFKKYAAVLLLILVSASLLYSGYKAHQCVEDLQEITQEQKEAMELWETWKKCV